MAKYFKQSLSPALQDLPRPPLPPLLGGKLARKFPIAQTMRAQDRVITSSRRIVLRQGLSGSIEFLVPNTDVVGVSHPQQDAARVVARTRVDLTPGNLIRLRAICALSGQTRLPGDLEGGAVGRILVASAYTNASGTTLTTNHAISIPPSPLEFAAAPTDSEGQWKSLRVVTIDLMRPEPLDSVADINEWTLPALVQLTVSHEGGARVIDLCAHERPFLAAMEADDAADRWCSHHYGSGKPQGPGPQFTFPLQRLSESTPDGDPRVGTWHLQDVANAQALRLGPVLLHWTSWDEDAEGVDDTEGAPVQVTSAAFQCLHNSSLSSYDASKEGFSVAAGAYARTSEYCDPRGMPYSGVIPVRVRVYASTGDGTTTGVVRVWTSPHQWVDVTIPAGTTYAWRHAYGFARVGRGPGQPAIAQLFARRTAGASTVNVRNAVVHYSGRYTPVG